MSIFKLFRRRLAKRANSSATELRLKRFSAMSTKELVEKFDITYDPSTRDPEGLTTTVAGKKLDRIGSNEITVVKKQTTFDRILESAVNPFNIVLAIIIIVSYVTDHLTTGKIDWATIYIILAMIVISSLVSFIQSQRSSMSAARLASMISNTATVYRDGAPIEIKIFYIVPGDIIRLSAGDMIPADVRFLSTKDTFVAQAALTGESNPVEKFAHARIDKKDSLTDLKNLGFTGSNVVSGSATAVVLATGNNTYFGSMAKTLNDDKGKNSFERGVSAVSKLLIRMIVVMVPLIFIINGFLKADWSASLLFAVSVAVGLTPEMLPVILTSTLATGAVQMAKRQVIVKQLGSIQTLGEMDILCTDKTGTLTEDKIILEKYMDVHGKDSTYVLKDAYLNAYFQAGLKGLLDLAVIKRAEKNGLSSVLTECEIINEIPFDFTRRRLSVILKGKKHKRQLITKGAVEEVLSICSQVEINGKIEPLTEDHRKLAMRTYEKYNDRGLRMIAVAKKQLPHFISNSFSAKDEKDLILVGFVGFLDPPKASAKAAVTELRESGIRTIVLTGDSIGVARTVCEQVGIKFENALTGKDIDSMDDENLRITMADCELFAKLSPTQKERIVRVLQEAGHTVGYVGDGINDAPPLHQADVGISVDTAVDIAKETASVILLKKDLTVLGHGVIEGRRTFGNVSKYIKLAVSSNFGNMISVLVASIALPFLPMLPIQILTQNLLSDFSQLGVPFDNMDRSYLKKPRKWDPKSIATFMVVMGPVSSLFDILCFATLWFIFGYNTPELAPFFWAGWFLVGSVTQVLVIHIARTDKVPFIKSRPSLPLTISTFSAVAVAAYIAFSPLAGNFQMAELPLTFAIPTIILVLLYSIAVQFTKQYYIKTYRQWI